MATELGKAFIQIVPSAKGISGAISEEMGIESEVAGKKSGSRLVGAIKKVLVGAAIGKFFAESIKEGGALEQSLGGIETLFKDSADKVKKNAQEAFITSGLSANEYMENVTSFSASLLQSLAGDTDKAADVAQMAMVDMADNANKMGTDMKDIQNAYQGFAKQNYTMLDNLKLGYGGTKTEMERLLRDAEKFSGVEYNIDSLSDVYEAIHVIQQEMDITGTTALEAAETIQGSFAAMKSAFRNTLGALALGENIGPSLQGLAQTVSTFLFGNLIPMVLTIIKSLIPAISELLKAGVPQLITSGMELIQSLTEGTVSGLPGLMASINEIVSSILDWFVNSGPALLSTGVDLIVNFASGLLSQLPLVLDNIGQIAANILNALFDLVPVIVQKGFELIAGLAKGLMDNLPAVVESINNILKRLIAIIIERFPEILSKGWELIGKLASGLWNNLPTIITTITNIIVNLLKTIAQNFPKILQKGFELLGELAKGLVKGIPTAVRKIPEIFRALSDGFKGILSGMVEIGRNIIMSLADGIGRAAGAVVAKAKEVAGNILRGVKSFFGIASPSKVFMEIGKHLDEGLASGITDNAGQVSKAMDEMTQIATGSFESDLAINSNLPGAIQGLSETLTIDGVADGPPQPAYMTFNFMGHRFKAFVEDITKVQEREIEAELAY